MNETGSVLVNFDHRRFFEAAEDKAALEKIAEKKKVSLAWVLRDAVSIYLQSDHKTI